MSSYQYEAQRPKPTQFQSAEDLGVALGVRRNVTVDVQEFVRTRDALTSAYMNLSQSIDQAVKAYLNHTQTIINGDGALNATLLLEPFNQLTQSAQHVAQQALRAQGNDSIDPQLLQNGQAEQNGEGGDKKKRKKRAYKQRDPNAPRRPLTAYFRYLGEQRPGIMEEVKKDPSKFEEAGKPGDISKIATKRWNALTEAQQLPYKEEYRKALGTWEKKMEEYKRQSGHVAEDKKPDADAMEVDPELEAEGGADAGADEEEEHDSEDSESSDSDSDSDAEGESDDQVQAKPAPAPAPKPTKKEPAAVAKSTTKKGAKQAQTFSSIPSPPAAAPTPAPAKAASPSKKRKAAAEPEPEPEEPAKSSKKKSRKSTVTAGADPVTSPAPAAAAPTPAAAPQSSPPVTSDKASKKTKKDKKKRKSSAGEA